MAYREIRVRPVVRYIVTDYQCDDEMRSGSSIGLGIFDNALLANRVARAVLTATFADHPQPIVFEPARQLEIHWIRGADEPKEAIRWELREVDSHPGTPISRETPAGEAP